MLQNFYKILSKKEKNIKKFQFFYFLSYLVNASNSIKVSLFMDEEKKWMQMTYYCPTHGDLGVLKPIEIIKKDISKKFSKNQSSSKINN